MDACIGRLNQTSMFILREGVFFGMCSEICGVGHSNMPIVVEPEMIADELENYKIVQNMNVVPCMMSQTQFEKYSEMWSKEKAIDALARMRGYDEDSPFNVNIS